MSNEGQIKANDAALRSASSMFAESSTATHEAIVSYENSANMLTASWEGAGAALFAASHIKLSGLFMQTVRFLEKESDAILSVNERFIERDRALKQDYAGIETDL